MSNDLITHVYQRQVGNLSRKAVLALFADKANDDGTGIWASKQRMADELGTSRQTIITTIKNLIDDGLIREVGQRKCTNGFTVEYVIVIKALMACPVIEHHQSSTLTRKAALPVKQLNVTRQAALHKPSRTPHLKPKEVREHVIPDGWEPSQFGKGTKSRKVVDGWPPDTLAGHLEHFTAHHRARGNKFKDWQDVWSTWVLNSDKFGGQRNGNGHRNTGGPSPDRRSTLARVLDEGLDWLGTGAQAGIS